MKKIDVKIEVEKMKNRYVVLAIFEEGASTGIMCLLDNAKDAGIAADFAEKVVNANNKYNDLYAAYACGEHPRSVCFMRRTQSDDDPSLIYEESLSFSDTESRSRVYSFCNFLIWCIHEDQKKIR